MRTTLLALSLIFAFNAQANIDYSPNEVSKATPQEIAQSRACFEELKVQGCGDPGEDIQQFKSCLKNVHPTLTANCQKMMTELYGKQ